MNNNRWGDALDEEDLWSDNVDDVQLSDDLHYISLTPPEQKNSISILIVCVSAITEAND